MIIKYLKNLLPIFIIDFCKSLRQYVVLTFGQLLLIRRIKGIYYRNSVLTKKKINVIFIVQFPEMWNSLKTVYDSMQRDQIFSSFVLCVPKMISNKNNKQEFSSNNEAYEFCLKNNINAVNAYEGGKWFDLNYIRPNYIFLQRPYDKMMPKLYRTSELSKYSLLCYIPYSERLTKGIHVRIEFNDNILSYAYIFFADCKESKCYIENNTMKIMNNKYRKIYDIGYPRFDLISEKVESDRIPTKFLWTPRWSVSTENDRSYFFDYLDCILEFFKQNKKFSLVIRPHPLMFNTFIENGFMTQTDVENLKKMIESQPNISFDKNNDYLISFDNSDALISDSSSLLYEYALTFKPIAFCGDYTFQDYTEIGKIISDTFYNITNKEELLVYLKNITNGLDYKKELRKSNIEKISFNKNVGQKIKDVIVKDFYDN